MKLKIYLCKLVVCFNLLTSCVTFDVNSSIVFPHNEEVNLPTGSTQFVGYFKNSTGELLEYVQWKSESPKINILLYPGQTGLNYSYKLLYKELSRYIDCNFILFNHRGLGLSDGKTGYENVLSDASNQWQKFQTFTDNSLPTILVGHSFGSHLILNLALKEDITFPIILISPLSNISDLVDTFSKNPEIVPQIALPFLKITINDNIKNLDNVKLIEKIPNQILLIHGALDKELPISMARKLANIKRNSKTELVEVEDIGHSDMIDFKNIENLVQIIMKFINYHLTTPSSG